jgi:hypothetical protein
VEVESKSKLFYSGYSVIRKGPELTTEIDKNPTSNGRYLDFDSNGALQAEKINT